MGAEDLRSIRDKLRTGMFGNRETWERQLEAGADEIDRLKEAKRKFSLLCDAKGAENVKLRQENERLRSLVKLAADAWAGGSQDECCVACMSIAEAPPQAFVEAKKERDEGWPGMGDAEQSAREKP